MIRSRLGLRALVLSGLLLGLMAFSASAAQAEIGAKWKVKGADVGSTEPKLKIKELENKTATLSFTTKGGTGVLILCTTAEFGEGGKLIGNGGISLGDVLFKTCSVMLNEKPASNCHPHSPTKPELSGEILSEKATGLILLDTTGGVTSDLVKLTPDTGTIFAKIELGELCAIGEKVDVEGELWIKDCKGDTSFLTESASHLIEESLNKLIALGVSAKIIGSAVVELDGANNGFVWAGFPN